MRDVCTSGSTASHIADVSGEARSPAAMGRVGPGPQLLCGLKNAHAVRYYFMTTV